MKMMSYKVEVIREGGIKELITLENITDAINFMIEEFLKKDEIALEEVKIFEYNEITKKRHFLFGRYSSNLQLEVK